MKSGYIIINIFFILFFVSNCRPEKISESKNKFNLADSALNKSGNSRVSADSAEILYIKPRSLVFFSLSENEYKKFIHLTGKESEREFNLIYKRFKTLAENTKKALGNDKNTDIKIFYTVNPVIGFLTSSGDTVFFKRKENDLFVGQIFFNGEDSLITEEGLMRKDSLERYIEKYFNIKDINIKQVFIQSENQGVMKYDSVTKEHSDTLEIPEK